jgi:p-hydroxybenzoate 3-monooxygenase
MDRFSQTGYESRVHRLEACVCVVGAGPAGLVVAHRLLSAGVSCILLERSSSEALCQRAKAGMLEHRSVQALARHGLAAPILERGTTNGMVEICVDGTRQAFDYAALTGGRGHYVYPQHLLVRAWADQLLAAGGHVSFSTEALSIETSGAAGASPSGAAGASVVARSPSGPLRVECEAVVLASGAGGQLVPSDITSHDHSHPFRWLTTMVEMAPLGERTIYATHPRGFAAHLRRSPQLTRYYLQIPAGDRLDAWSDDRVKAELELRLGIERRGLITGPVLERDVVDLRVRVREPLQHGCVYLAGDAAHLITPAGGKGMNLAIADALELADGLLEQHAGRPERLARYSDTRLPAIWRMQEFSNWMLTLFCGGVLNFHKGAPDPAASFARRLHRAQVERLFTEPAFARWFAHRYAGVDESP